MTREEILARAENLYATRLRVTVERAENDGKIIVIDPESEDYEISADGLDANRLMLQKHPQATLVGLKIGEDSVESFSAYVSKNPKE